MPENPYAMTPVVTPIVHLNGNRKSTLLKQLGAAYGAVQDALTALAQAAPNGRNYYLVPGRMEEALRQRRFAAREGLGPEETNTLSAEDIAQIPAEYGAVMERA